MANVMEAPKCDYGCGSEATMRLAHVGLCDECFEREAQETWEPILGYRPCCTIMWTGDIPSMCLMQAGIEHAHT